MGIVVFAVSLLVSLHVAAAVQEGTYYNCSKINTTGSGASASQECQNTLWCYWLGGQCYYDQYLKAVSTTEYNTANGVLATLCGADGLNGAGSKPGLFYITDIHECVDCNQTSFADIYCRENGGPAFERTQAIGKCFYADLELRGDPTHTVSQVPKVLGTQCIKNQTLAVSNSEVGYYVYNDPNYSTETDCSQLGVPSVCDCLGKVGLSWCHLHPECTLNKAGNACIVDPCTVNNGGASKGQACSPQAAGCTTSSQLWQVTDAGVASATKFLCVATGDHTTASINNDTNECFYAYRGKSTPGVKCPLLPECNVNTEINKCETSKQNDDAGSQIDALCTLQSLPDGYFPLNKYCSDGRSVPSLSGASLLRVPFLFVFGALLALFHAV